MIKLLLIVIPLVSIFLAAAASFYYDILKKKLDSLQAVNKLKKLIWVIIILEAIAIIYFTYRIRFSPFKSKYMFFGFITGDIYFIWDLFRWMGLLKYFKSPQKLVCGHYLDLHKKYMKAGQYEQADAAAKRALEYESQNYWVYLKLANDSIFAKSNSEHISEYLETAREIINKNGNKNEEAADYMLSLAFLSASKEETAKTIEYLKQSLGLHYSKIAKKLLKDLENNVNSKSG